MGSHLVSITPCRVRKTIVYQRQHNCDSRSYSQLNHTHTATKTENKIKTWLKGYLRGCEL